MTILGTRAEAIKMAPLIYELKKHEELHTLVCVTAQHRPMLDQVLNIFDIKPDYEVNIIKDNQTLVDVSTRALCSLNQVIHEAKPDMILVHGDTTTTFIASLVSFYNKVAVGHVEAGLRTENKYSPFPKEMNRQLTGVIADLHFAPTDVSANNLLRENKSNNTIFITGNTAIDAQKTTIRQDYSHPVLKELNSLRLILMTTHRRENFREPMERIFKAILRLVEKHEDIAVVYPVQWNPAVRESVHYALANHSRIHLIEPLNVIDFHNIMSRSYLILTDSGGVQEEAPALGIPVLVLRNTTERSEGVAVGTLKLVGMDEDVIFELADELLTDKNAYTQMSQAANPYGDGEASRRITEAILYYYGFRKEKPDHFTSLK